MKTVLPLLAVCFVGVLAAADESPTFVIAPVEVTTHRGGVWALQDRLLDHAEYFQVSPSYSVTHRRFRDTLDSESDLAMVNLSLGRERPWNEADLEGAQVHFVWLRDGEIEWAQDVPVVGKFHASGAFAAMAVRSLPGGQELVGSPAILVSKDGEFIAPRPWFGDNARANRVAFKIVAGIDDGLATDIEGLADPNVSSSVFRGVTLAHIAAEAGHVKALAALAAAGADLNREDRNRTSPLWWATEKNRVQAVEWLLEQGVKTQANLAGKHLVESAVERGHIEAAAAIYRRQNSKVFRDEMLGGAAYVGKRELSRELLADYSNFRVRWMDGEPLWWVAQSGDVELMALMLDRGVNARRQPHSVPLLNLAARAGDLAMVQLLVERGAKVKARDPAGRTALMEATLGGHVEVAAWLMQQGADATRKDRDGLSALQVAEQRQDARLVAVLRGAVAADASLAAGSAPVMAEWQVDTKPLLRQRPAFRLVREMEAGAESRYQGRVVLTSPLSVGGAQVLGEEGTTAAFPSVSSIESNAHFAYWTGIIETDGTVSHAVVLNAGPYPFRANVEEVLGDYRFEPARRDGKPVRTRVVWVEDLR
ncbi:ankyrin repeat domain-containing protein [Actomonas aquatica]|uniref:Ankyrin repeat domain-containing protein n=1 Tax=Actomonas aquatica TaxID=2866162 RepID=A0ABZ1C634_9BACT|nr:ankyrin repeat domain-containing protein [Opitutus sp. WL0086]WRQ86825.1 ankyrin repeat domain-containing protein [Opitutus sp. WL0086]